MELKDFGNRVYDVCIIGGGVYGAWLARDAVLRGLSVALVDRGDFGSSTSQSSSKLLHGGLRYLEQFEFGLVRKSLRERDVLANVIPQLVKPLRFVVPIYKDSRIGAFRMRLGLKIYDQLAGTESICASPYKKISTQEAFETYPWLQQNDFRAALEYSDASTDDARLAYQVIASAENLGADVRHYTEATITHAMDAVKVIKVKDVDSDEEAELKCKSVVMTTGPWLDAGIGINGKAREKSRLTKGVHLLMPSLGLTEAMTLMAPEDGRVFFMIPWYGRTMVGTTDTDYRGKVEDCGVELDDVEYILHAVNAFLGEEVWTDKHIQGAFCGLRVLQSNDSSHPSQASREWAFPEIRPGVFRSIGGKLTSAREDAVKALDHVVECMNFDVNESNSHMVPIGKNYRGFQYFKDQLRETHVDIDKDVFENLMFRYGEGISEILKIINDEPALLNRIDPELPFILAEIDYICRFEHTRHLDDILRRRMPLMILLRYSDDVLKSILSRVSINLGWSKEKAEVERQRVVELWQNTLPSQLI